MKKLVRWYRSGREQRCPGYGTTRSRSANLGRKRPAEGIGMRKDATGIKVGIAFAFLVALLVGVGWLGLSRLGQLNACANRLFNERGQRRLETRQAVSYFN